MVTLKQINKALTQKGLKFELVRGEGYFYVVGEGTEYWADASIMVYQLNHMTFEQWMSSVESLIAEGQARQ